jgi:hypothetical protein
MPTDLTPAPEATPNPAPEGAESGASAEANAEAPAATPEGGTDGKPDAAPAGAPETFADFTFPEGVQPDEGLLEEFLTLAKELNLSQDQAQKLVDLQSGGLQKMAEAITEKIEADKHAEMAEWDKEAKADKEFGGDKFEESMLEAKKAALKFGTEELLEVLDATGVGSHPELVRFFVRVGKALGDDKMLFGNAQQVTEKSAAEILFPTMAKE